MKESVKKVLQKELNVLEVQLENHEYTLTLAEGDVERATQRVEQTKQEIQDIQEALS